METWDSRVIITHILYKLIEFLPPHSSLDFWKLTSVDDETVNVLLILLNFSWNLSSDVSARCSSHPQGDNI